MTSITQGTTVASFTHDNANRRSTLTYPNGIIATHGYDNANQLTSLSYALGQTTLGDLTYTYDTAGQRTSVGGSWARTGLPSALNSATYDAANRITSWGATPFTYDPNGNLASDGLTSYTWNARNQLVELSGATSATFQYDGLRRRRSKTISGTTTNFLYDGWNFVQEQTGGGTPTANLLTGLGVDQIFARTDGIGASGLLVDGLGSTLELADSSGTLRTQSMVPRIACWSRRESSRRWRHSRRRRKRRSGARPIAGLVVGDSGLIDAELGGELGLRHPLSLAQLADALASAESTRFPAAVIASSGCWCHERADTGPKSQP